MFQVYEMLCESLAWRRHHNIDNIREIWQPPEPLLNYYCGGWHNTDKGMSVSVKYFDAAVPKPWYTDVV